MSLVPPPQEASDIFSLSDQALSERYQFVEEIGFGNWGSVWLCRPKDDEGKPIEDGQGGLPSKVAVKLVHRSKTPTTAARVRSLWNEMKIVRSFKHDPHPSIIPFHNFIITPSYALITMSYLPSLVPVEVPELRAKSWFLSLISAIAFLHARGVVHNDIKPANILLTATDPSVPVLVDFGFAEKYDIRSTKAFLSNLAYGTPEYLSPERARGLPHDTRKSDVWSLGVTIFEILAGRTPFEHTDHNGDTETFSTKEDLEKYWARTVKGKWIGKWSMSKGLEKLLRKMILPNADLRITAPVALNDPYFDPAKPETPGHNKSNSSIYMRSIASEEEASRIVDASPPWKDQSLSPPASLLRTVAAVGRRENKENARTRLPRTGKENVNVHVRRDNVPGHQKTKSQSHIGKDAAPQTRLPTLAQPFKHAARKAQSFHISPGSSSSNQAAPTSRKAGLRTSNTATNATDASMFSANTAEARGNTSFVTASSFASKENSVPGSQASSRRRVPTRKPVPAIFAAAHKGIKAAGLTNNSNDNVIYEEEEQRGKEKGRREPRVLGDLTKIKTNEATQDEETATYPQDNRLEQRIPLPPVVEDSPRLFPNDTFPRSPKESTGIGTIKQSIVRIYKSSTLGSHTNLLSKQSTSGPSGGAAPESSQSEERPSEETRESWENESVVRNVKSSLPAVRHAIRNEQVAADNRLDRMTIWIRNVERVVEDARANFAAGGMTPLPPLPPRIVHSPTTSRRDVKADQVFQDDGGASREPVAPRPRRTSLLSRFPDVPTIQDKTRPTTADDGEPRRTQSALYLSRPITHPTQLHQEVEQQDDPQRSPKRLSDVLDPNAFFLSKPTTEDSITDAGPSNTLVPQGSSHVSSGQNLQPDTYEQFLLATTSVKRVGKGYQSNLMTSNIVTASAPSFKTGPVQFNSARSQVPPPQDGPRKAASVDQFGSFKSTSAISRKEDGNNTIKFMRRAIKAITGGSVSRRLSKAV